MCKGCGKYPCCPLWVWSEMGLVLRVLVNGLHGEPFLPPEAAEVDPLGEDSQSLIHLFPLLGDQQSRWALEGAVVRS